MAAPLPRVPSPWERGGTEGVEPPGPATGLQAEKNAAPLLPSTGGGVGVMCVREGAHPWPSQTRRPSAEGPGRAQSQATQVVPASPR